MIFGDEKYKKWNQTLPNKQKYPFFNPVWQNKAHINAIEGVLGKEVHDVCKSYIVFSDRCTLKKIKIHSENVTVLKRSNLLGNLKKDIKSSASVLTPIQVESLHISLAQFSLASETVKKAHLKEVKIK